MAGSLGIQESGHLAYKSDNFVYRVKARTSNFSLLYQYACGTFDLQDERWG